MEYLYRYGYLLIKYCYWWPLRPHTKGTKCLIYNQHKEILLVRHTYGQRAWSLPGGNVRGVEDPSTTTTREMKEELDIDISPKLLGTLFSTKDYKRDTIYCFEATIDERQRPSVVTRELSEQGWFPVDNPPRDRAKIVKKVLLLNKHK